MGMAMFMVRGRVNVLLAAGVIRVRVRVMGYGYGYVYG